LSLSYEPNIRKILLTAKITKIQNGQPKKMEGCALAGKIYSPTLMAQV
jgi:hypothetical protein